VKQLVNKKLLTKDEAEIQSVLVLFSSIRKNEDHTYCGGCPIKNAPIIDTN
jgi:hypothetical protein